MLNLIIDKKKTIICLYVLMLLLVSSCSQSKIDLKISDLNISKITMEIADGMSENTMSIKTKAYFNEYVINDNIDMDKLVLKVVYPQNYVDYFLLENNLSSPSGLWKVNQKNDSNLLLGRDFKENATVEQLETIINEIQEVEIRLFYSNKLIDSMNFTLSK